MTELELGDFRGGAAVQDDGCLRLWWNDHVTIVMAIEAVCFDDDGHRPLIVASGSDGAYVEIEGAADLARRMADSLGVSLGWKIYDPYHPGPLRPGVDYPSAAEVNF